MLLRLVMKCFRPCLDNGCVEGFSKKILSLVQFSELILQNAFSEIVFENKNIHYLHILFNFLAKMIFEILRTSF